MTGAACGAHWWEAVSWRASAMPGLDRTVALPVKNPTDVAFGGPDLDRLYVVSIGLGATEARLRRVRLFVIDGLGIRGRPEPRCHAVAPNGVAESETSINVGSGPCGDQVCDLLTRAVWLSWPKIILP